MRKDTTFSNRKLTEAEFSKKYWRGGRHPYQYHTGSVSDGRDEREQFLFNNCRALFELMDLREKHNRETIFGLCGRIEALEKLLASSQPRDKGDNLPDE